MKPEIGRRAYHEDLQNFQPSNLVLTFSAHKAKRKMVTEFALPVG